MSFIEPPPSNVSVHCQNESDKMFDETDKVFNDPGNANSENLSSFSILPVSSKMSPEPSVLPASPLKLKTELYICNENSKETESSSFNSVLLRMMSEKFEKNTQKS